MYCAWGVCGRQGRVILGHCGVAWGLAGRCLGLARTHRAGRGAGAATCEAPRSARRRARLCPSPQQHALPVVPQLWAVPLDLAAQERCPIDRLCIIQTRRPGARAGGASCRRGRVEAALVGRMQGARMVGASALLEVVRRAVGGVALRRSRGAR